MLEQNKETGLPWYREFWAWFVFTPLIVVVIACTFTVTLAFKYKDGVVKDDYYKIGKMINSDFTPDQKAKELGLIARVSFDAESNMLRSELNNSNWAADDTLLLALSHPVDENRDHFITLNRIDDLIWQASSSVDLQGRWYVRLAAIDDDGAETWRLHGEITLPASEPFILN